jgi:hypothetical protein
MAARQSSHRASTRARTQPPSTLELNAALLEYLSRSPGSIIWELLKIWAATWGLSRFDTESIYKVLDLLVEDMGHAIADQVKAAIGNTGVAVEKDQILHVLRLFKGTTVRSIKDYLKARGQRR